MTSRRREGDLSALTAATAAPHRRSLCFWAVLVTSTALGGCAGFDNQTAPRELAAAEAAVSLDAPSSSCVPRQCADWPATYGVLEDGCGGHITCKDCPRPLQNDSAGNCICEPGQCEVICDDRDFVGYRQTPFRLTEEYSNTVIRNCSFIESNRAAIIIDGAHNVLIEDSVFFDIRSDIAGKDCHAINIPASGSHITIRNNSFIDIGADGVQMGNAKPLDGQPGSNPIERVVIWGNTFTATNEDVGENGVDIKNVVGPVIVIDNLFHGFRPCEPATQDCSGSGGAAMVLHMGANNIHVERNRFVDNSRGLAIGRPNNPFAPTNVRVFNNLFHDNLVRGLTIQAVDATDPQGIQVLHNTFLNNGGRHLAVGCEGQCPGVCDVHNNLFVGDDAVEGGCDEQGNQTLSLAEAAFVNESWRDLRLTRRSLAIDAGVDAPRVGWDFARTSRPRGEAADVGAYEWAGQTAIGGI